MSAQDTAAQPGPQASHQSSQLDNPRPSVTPDGLSTPGDYLPPLPAAVLRCPWLAMRAREAYAVLRRWHMSARRHGRDAFHINPLVLGSEIGRSRRTAVRALQDLRRAGLLTVVRCDGRHNWARLLPLPEAVLAHARGDAEIGPDSRGETSQKWPGRLANFGHQVQREKVDEIGSSSVAAGGPPAAFSEPENDQNGGFQEPPEPEIRAPSNSGWEGGSGSQTPEAMDNQAMDNQAMDDRRVPVPERDTREWRRAWEDGREVLGDADELTGPGAVLWETLASYGYGLAGPAKRQRRNWADVCASAGALLAEEPDLVDESNVGGALVYAAHEVGARSNGRDKGPILADLVRRGLWRDLLLRAVRDPVPA